MKVEELHDRAAWAEFTKANDGGLLQSFELGELHTEVERRCLFLVVREEGVIRLTAMVLRKPIALGYTYYYCPEGPVVKDGNWNDARNKLALAALNRHLRKRSFSDRAVYLKIEPHIPTAKETLQAFTELRFRPSKVSLQAEHVAHVDITRSETAIWDSFKKDARYSIRYAERQGVEIIRGRGPREMAMFAKLYHQTASDKSFSHRDKSYLETFRQHLMEDTDVAEVYVALCEGKPIAASIITYYGDEAVYLYAGSNKRNQTLYGTYLIQWEAIKEAKRRGCRRYNMTGVAASSDSNDPWAGLRRFKLKFGSTVVHLVGAQDYAYKPVLYRILSLGSAARKLVLGSKQTS